MDAAAELGRNPVSKHQIQPEYGKMSRLTRDGTAEPVSRDQIPRHARGQGNIIFHVQLTTSKIGNLNRLIHTLLYVTTNFYRHVSLALLQLVNQWLNFTYSRSHAFRYGRKNTFATNSGLTRIELTTCIL